MGALVVAFAVSLGTLIYLVAQPERGDVLVLIVGGVIGGLLALLYGISVGLVAGTTGAVAALLTRSGSPWFRSIAVGATVAMFAAAATAALSMLILQGPGVDLVIGAAAIAFVTAGVGMTLRTKRNIVRFAEVPVAAVV